MLVKYHFFFVFLFPKSYLLFHFIKENDKYLYDSSSFILEIFFYLPLANIFFSPFVKFIDSIKSKVENV